MVPSLYMFCLFLLLWLWFLFYICLCIKHSFGRFFMETDINPKNLLNLHHRRWFTDHQSPFEGNTAKVWSMRRSDHYCMVQGRFKTPFKDKFEFLDACHPLSGHVASSTETEDGEVQSGLFLSFNSGLETQIETLPPQIKSKVRVKLKLTRLQYLVLALF